MRAYVSLLVVPTLSACALVDENSFTDPVYANKRFDSVMVFGLGMGLEERSKAEQTVVDELIQHGAVALRSIDHVLPTRGYSDDEIAEIINKSGTQSTLALAVEGRRVRSEYVLPGHPLAAVFGGMVLEKPRAMYVAKLYEVDTGKVVWMTEYEERGSIYDDLIELTEEASEEIAEELIDGDLF